MLIALSFTEDRYRETGKVFSAVKVFLLTVAGLFPRPGSRERRKFPQT
jgi:hypothetical protein